MAPSITPNRIVQSGAVKVECMRRMHRKIETIMIWVGIEIELLQSNAK